MDITHTGKGTAIAPKERAINTKFNDTDFSVVTRLIYCILGDMDSAIIVAKQWLKYKAEIADEKNEKARRYYLDLLWLEKPGDPERRQKHSLGELAQNICLWNQDYIVSRESMMQPSRSNWRSIWRRMPQGHRLCVNPHKDEIRYVASYRGIRSLSGYRPSAAAWGIKDLDKDELTMKDKLNDIKLIPMGTQGLGMLSYLIPLPENCASDNDLDHH